MSNCINKSLNYGRTQSANDADGLRRLYRKLADLMSCRVPERSYETTAVSLGRLYDQGLNREVPEELHSDRAIVARLDEALKHPRFRWRSIEQVAAVAAVTENTASRLLRADNRVRFSRGKSGNTIVGLRSRVD
jgi:hypothetical protein